MKQHPGSTPRPFEVLACLGLVFAGACGRPEPGSASAPDAAFASEAAPSAAPTAPPLRTPDDATAREPDEPATVVCDLPSGAITKVGEHAYVVQRALLVPKLEEPVTVPHSGDTAGPYYRNGVYAGLRFLSVKPSSVMRSLGFRSGDVLVSVNDRAFESPNRYIDIFDTLKRDTQLRVGVLRSGRTLTFEYDIR